VLSEDVKKEIDALLGEHDEKVKEASEGK